MNKKIIMGVIVLLAITSIAFTNAFAAGNSFKYSDQFKEKILCSKVYGYCDYFYFGKFQIDAKIYFDGVDINQFNDGTCFYVEVANFAYDACLGDDYLYSPGKTKASFIEQDYDWVSDRENVPYLWVTMKWNKKYMSMKVKGLTGTPDIGYPVLAYDFMWWGENDTIQESNIAYLEFAGIEKTFDVNSTGKVKVKTTKKYGSEYEYYDIKIKGKGYEILE
jgi:hypothetical protein